MVWFYCAVCCGVAHGTGRRNQENRENRIIGMAESQTEPDEQDTAPRYTEEVARPLCSGSGGKLQH